MKKKVLLRIDNVHANEKVEPGCIERLTQLMSVFDRYSVPVLLGITPCYGEILNQKDSIFSKDCVTQKGIEVIKSYIDKGHFYGLHGLTHRCRMCKDSEHEIERVNPTLHEFRCLDYERIHGHEIPVDVQATWLEEGNQWLDKMFGARTNIFLPPAHYYSRLTIDAMLQTGYKIIMTYDRWVSKPYKESNGIIICPCDFEDFARLAEVCTEKAIKPFVDYIYSLPHSFLHLFFHTKYVGDTIEDSSLAIISYIIEKFKKNGAEFIEPRYSNLSNI
jgi:peptidoglycan/xylan/chitin deacetylase (PgdA/CDA1 family)